MDNLASHKPFVIAPSTLLQNYVTAPNGATSSTIPNITDLQKLQVELQLIQSDLSDRDTKLRNDHEKLRLWRAKGKQKEKAPSALPVPSNGTIHDKKLLNKLSRTGSATSSSTDLSEPEVVQIKPARNTTKRKRGIADTDDDYSDIETIDRPTPTNKLLESQPLRKSTSSASFTSAPPLPAVAPPQAVSSSSSPMKLQSPAPASVPLSAIGSLASSLSFKAKDSSTPPPVLRKSSTLVPTSAEFALPARKLVPPAPPSELLPPLPKHQSEVTDDFSQAKPGTQVPFSTFQGAVEPYLRNFGEDDVAYLTHKSEDFTPFLIPALGRHYTETWAEEDGARPNPLGSALELPALEAFRSEDITSDRLRSDVVYAGPLTERLLSALLDEGLPAASDNDLDEIDLELRLQQLRPSPPPEDKMDIDQTQDVTDSALALDGPPDLDAVDVEDRIRRELRFLGIFPTEVGGQTSRIRDGEVDWSMRTDDEISAALRACQRQLSEQIGLNEMRKAKLADRVKDRLARQEFETLRDGLEKIIESGYLKRQRAIAKRKTKEKEAAASANPAAAIAVVEKIPAFSESLSRAMDRRKKLTEGIAPIFDNAEPGRFKGIPYESIYSKEELDQLNSI